MSDELNSSIESAASTGEQSLRHLILTHTSRVDNMAKLLGEEREAMQRERAELQELMGLMRDMINSLDARDTEQRTRVAALARVETRLTSNLDRLAVQVRRLMEAIDRKD